MFNPMNYNKPLPTGYIKDIFKNTREVKQLFEERLGLEHYIGESTDPADFNCDGYHKYITLFPQEEDPEHDGVYCKEYNGEACPFYKKSGVVYQLAPLIITEFSFPEEQYYRYALSPADSYLWTPSFDFLSYKECVNYSKSYNIGDGELHVGWNLTGNPSIDENIDIKIPQDTPIYMRVWIKFPDNTVKQSQNQLYFKLVFDRYDYYPSEFGWFHNINDAPENPFFRWASFQEWRIFRINFQGQFFTLTPIPIPDSVWAEAESSSGWNFTDTCTFYKTGNAINKKYYTRVRIKRLKVEYL